MYEQKTLFWLFIGIFAVTAIITLLGITGVLKNIKEKYLNTLFTALIMEVVAGILLMFQAYNLPNTQLNIAGLLQEAGVEVTGDVKAQKQLLIRHLTAGITLPKIEAEKKVLEVTVATKDKLIADCNGSLGEKENRFYKNILRLNALTTQYMGGNINLGFEPDKKEEVYQILLEVFNELGEFRDGDAVYLEDGKTMNKTFVRELYAKFRERYGRSAEEFDNIYLDKFDVSQMFKTYLDKQTQVPKTVSTE